MKNYAEQFEAKANTDTSNKIYLTDNTDKYLDRKLSISLNTISNGLSNLLFVKLYLIKKDASSQEEFKFDFDLIVSFGTKENTKRFSTSNTQDAKLLKDLGFKFDIYVKKLNEATDEKN